MAECVSEIRPLPSDPNMRRVRVGNKTVATLRACDIERLNLDVGTAWTQRLKQAVERTVAMNKARRDAMNMLGRRQLSRQEIIDKLARKSHDPIIAQQLADELQSEGWIDDAAMATALRDELVHRKSAGRRLIQSKLKSRRIDDELAEQLSRNSTSSDAEFTNALALATRRLKALTGEPQHVAQRRIAATLARKGYDDEVIEQVLNTLHVHDRSPNDW